jgi:hypothetical protein
MCEPIAVAIATKFGQLGLVGDPPAHRNDGLGDHRHDGGGIGGLADESQARPAPATGPAENPARSNQFLLQLQQDLGSSESWVIAPVHRRDGLAGEVAAANAACLFTLWGPPR